MVKIKSHKLYSLSVICHLMLQLSAVKNPLKILTMTRCSSHELSDSANSGHIFDITNQLKHKKCGEFNVP